MRNSNVSFFSVSDWWNLSVIPSGTGLHDVLLGGAPGGSVSVGAKPALTLIQGGGYGDRAG